MMGMSITTGLVLALASALAVVGQARGQSPEAPVVDKTLVSWVTLANLDQRGGSALTLEDRGGVFDAIVLGELEPRRWMAGSELFHRTSRDQKAWPAETSGPDELFQIAVVYRGPEVTLVRDGKELARYTIERPHVFGPEASARIGPRHVGNGDVLQGTVDDARIYPFALDATQLQKLKPNEKGPFEPWAWWTFDDEAAGDRMGRLPHSQLDGGATVREGRLVLAGPTARFLGLRRAMAAPAGLTLDYHLMHPGGDSLPGDPNAAFALDGLYHLHYILAHPFGGRTRVSFVHVTSPDLLRWTWQPTKLEPAFTGHGMFSGTGFLTKEGKPAAIYHGEGSGRNQIAIAKDNRLTAWEKPYPVEVKNADGSPAQINHWDPDCFRVGDTYYAISGGQDPPLMKSTDLKNWTLVGPFLKHDLPDVARGEDISCPNFFPIGDQWMLLCISHNLGCRYYLGDWDSKAEQFVPRRHGRMNWARADQSLFGPPSWRVDFFAPESVQTFDGRRVMWAWLATVDTRDGTMSQRTIESLPRELSLAADGSLRIAPLRELESLRRDPVRTGPVTVSGETRELLPQRAPAGQVIARLPGEAAELRVVIPRAEAERKLCGITLFDDGQGGGLPILLRPESGALRVGSTQAPFAVSDLDPGEDVELRIYVDHGLVEVFASNRQALVAYHGAAAGRPEVRAWSVAVPTTLATVETWRIEPTNQGMLEARKTKVWEPRTGE